jgi:hypothetical protein
MSVAQEYFLPRALVFQDEAFVIAKAIKKCFFPSVYGLKIGVKILLNHFRILVYHVVISPNQMQSVVYIKQFQELIDVFMRLENGFELNILPELISVPEFDIVKTLVEVLFQGVEVDVPVVGEFICKTVIPPVAITKKDKFRIVIKWDSLCIGVGPVQTFGRSHKRSEGN